MDKKQLRNTLMLMACAFIWGTAFVAQSVGSDYMGPYTFLASRSWLACAFLLGLMAVLRKMGKTNPAAEPGFWQNKKVLLRGGIFCGVALFAASAAQQMGMRFHAARGSMSLGRILDENQGMSFCKGGKFAHRAGTSEEMHRENRAGARSDRCGNTFQ